MFKEGTRWGAVELIILPLGPDLWLRRIFWSIAPTRRLALVDEVAGLLEIAVAANATLAHFTSGKWMPMMGAGHVQLLLMAGHHHCSVPSVRQ